MKVYNFVFIPLLMVAAYLIAYNDQANDFIYGEGNTQVNSEINEYEDIVAGAPIQGSVLITHDKKDAIDINSFRIGDKPLKVEFIQTTSMSSLSNLEVSIYQFQITGLKSGVNTLPPISVKIGGKEFQAPPLTVEIGQ